jgi:DnaJ-class molecular chaperone
LGLNDWRISREAILSAWRQVLRDVHPDKVPEEDRDVATIVTQQINAAKEILTNNIARRRYHDDGVLPMAM